MALYCPFYHSFNAYSLGLRPNTASQPTCRYRTDFKAYSRSSYLPLAAGVAPEYGELFGRCVPPCNQRVVAVSVCLDTKGAPSQDTRSGSARITPAVLRLQNQKRPPKW